MALITKRVYGSEDVLPADSYKWQFIEDVMREEAASYGYKEIRTPVFEHTELFQRGVGDTTDVVQKEMYTFDTKGGTSITLRPEGTAGAARALLEHAVYNDGLPVKASYFVSCYRYEKKQANRYREFHQFGLEIYGTAHPSADAELISAAQSLFDRLGVTDLTLEINSIGCPECRAQYHKALRAYFEQYRDQLCETCLSRLERNPMRILDCKSPVCSKIAQGAPTVLDYICEECREHFAGVKGYLDSAGIAYTVNPKIVRGLDYYTRTVFEFITSSLGAQGTVCGGGRYDDLTGIFGMPNMSGVGISFGADRIYDVMTGLNLFPEEVSFTTRVLFTNLGAEEEAASLELLRSLRDAGVAAEIYPECGKMKKQMEYANRRSIPYVVIIGSQELEAQAATVKDMRSGEQRQVPFAALAADLESRR